MLKLGLEFCAYLPHLFVISQGRSVVLCELQKNSGRNQTSSGSVIFVETGKIAKKLKQKTVLNRLNPESPSRVDIVITGGAFRLLAAENSKLLRQGVKADDDRNVMHISWGGELPPHSKVLSSFRQFFMAFSLVPTLLFRFSLRES